MQTLSFAAVEYLRTKFVSRDKKSYISQPILPADGNSTVDLGSITNKFQDVYVTTLHADNIAGGSGTNADTVDSFHAYASSNPTANQLVALDANARWPVSLFAWTGGGALLKSGGNVSGNITCDAGVTVDGVDISAFNQANFLLTADHGSMPNRRTLVAGSGLIQADGGSGSSFTLAVGAGTLISVSADAVHLASAGGADYLIKTGVGGVPAYTTIASLLGTMLSYGGGKIDIAGADPDYIMHTNPSGNAEWYLLEDFVGSGLVADYLAHKIKVEWGGAGAGVSAAAAVAGAAASVSHSDHSHQVSVGSPVSVTLSPADGTANTLARSDHRHSLDVSIAPSWTGVHTFSNNVALHGNTTAHSILPAASDSYDLGSSSYLWRKGWLSELDAVVFALNTTTIIGGKFVIAQNSGTLVSPVLAADPMMDFGKVMSSGAFVEIRAAGQVEYVQVGTVIQGTIYNVTRNLDGSGANDWSTGTPFLVLGTSGKPRIELSVLDDMPMISMREQGATYNMFEEAFRVGDMYGAYNTGSNHRYGVGIGKASSGNYISYNGEIDGGFVIKAGSGHAWINNEGFALGVSSPVANTTIYKFTAWDDPAILYGGLSAEKVVGIKAAMKVNLYNEPLAYTNGQVMLQSKAPTGYNATTLLSATSGTNESHISIYSADSGGDQISLAVFGTPVFTISPAGVSFNSLMEIGSLIVTDTATLGSTLDVTGAITGASIVVSGKAGASFLMAGTHIGTPLAGEVWASGDIKTTQGLSVGSTSTNPNTGDVWATVDGRFGGGLYVGDTAIDPAAGVIIADTDIYTTAWASYTPTYTGWAATPTRKFYYKKVGKLVFVRLMITGTSNGTSATCSLPVAMESAPSQSLEVPIRAQDNTGTRVWGVGQIANGGSTITFYKDASGLNVWTASGTKEVQCEFFYHTA